MRTISIILGDNDFGSTFRPLLENIFVAIQYHGEMSREQIVKAIHFGIHYFYFTFQRREGGNHSKDQEKEFLDYLSDVKILFDEEAEADIQTNDHDSGAWYLELQTGNVYPY